MSEADVGGGGGRHLYGAFDPATEEYLVCAVRQDGDDADALGLVEKTLPGGRFARFYTRSKRSFVVSAGTRVG